MNIPYWRLSAFYWFYFAALGAWVPFWSVYLQFQGFSVVEIGQLMALFMVARILAPALLGWLADATGQCMALVRLASLLTVLFFLGVFVVEGHFMGMAAITLAFSFCWNAALPQLEAATFIHLGEFRYRYSHIRLWGSVGFIVAVASLGPLLERWSIEALPWVIWVCFVGLWVSSRCVPDTPVCPRATPSPVALRTLLRQPAVLSLVGVCFLMQAGHAPYYTFYSIYLDTKGYSGTVIGLLWALGVLAEVLLFLRVDRWISRYGVRALLLISLLLATVRWIIIGFWADTLGWLMVAQLLHAASFGLHHAAAIQLTHQLFKGQHHGKGQALYASLFGAGGAVGAMYSGYCWDLGGAMLAYGVAALLCLLGLGWAWRGIKLNMLEA